MIYDQLQLRTDEIRVLHLKSSPRRDDAIVCDLRVTSLSCDTVYYEALSYVWGNRMHSRKILLQGKPLAVTENLFISLQYLRSTEEDRILWIDALCIDQSNQKERENQVPLMSSIYKEAGNVVVWLGELLGNCNLALEFMKQLAENEHLHISPSQRPNAEVRGHSIESIQLQDALKNFFNRPWWSRIWTVQEFVLAGRLKFHIGQYQIDGEYVRRSARHFYRHQQSCCFKLGDLAQISLFDSLLALESLEYVRLLLNETTFPYILSQFRLRQATDTRDKVYGMMGLATGTYKNLVEPDYSSSVEDVFINSTLSMINRTHSLEILSHVPPFGQRNLVLPSFIPDWSIPHGEDSTYARWVNWLGHLHLYNACGGTTAVLRRLDSKSIALRGIIVDEIESTGSDFDSIPIADALREMRELARVNSVVEGEERYCDTAITRKVAFWTTICGSIEYFLDPARENRGFFRRIPVPTEFSRYEKWEAWVLSESKINPDKCIRSVQWPLSILTKGRKFIVTKRGCMGFCPSLCTNGDMIAVVMGGSVPLVIRPNQVSGSGERSGSEVQYTLVGDSYIHGYMDGEAFEAKGGVAERLADLVLL